FKGKNAVDLLRKHESERPASIRTLRRDVPDDIADLLEQMMQKDPALRPQSPQDVLDTLGRSTKSAEEYSQSWGAHQFNRTAVVHILALPSVWLPFLTCLLCLMWLLFR